LFEAVGNVFEWISGRDPTVAFLDDLQWADGATAELLLHLDRTLETAPVLVLGAYRSDEVSRGHPLRRLRSELRRRRRLQELTVEPLGPVDTAALAARVLGADVGSTLARTLYDRTQGVPFFIEELAVALATAGWLETATGTVELGPEETLPLPDTIKDTVLLGAERLSSVGRHTLEIAAAAGLRFDWSCWPPSAAPTASTKRSSGDSWWRWTSKARSATPSSARPSTTTHHGPDGAPTTGGWRRSWRGAAPEAVAEQWLAGGERDRARPSLLTAAERFCQVHAYHDAARAVRRALELWPDGQGQVAGSGVTADPSNRFG
jgi:hypothetical protein